MDFQSEQWQCDISPNKNVYREGQVKSHDKYHWIWNMDFQYYNWQIFSLIFSLPFEIWSIGSQLKIINIYTHQSIGAFLFEQTHFPKTYDINNDGENWKCKYLFFSISNCSCYFQYFSIANH